MSARGQDQRTGTPQAKRNLKVETGDPQSQRSCKVDSVGIDVGKGSGWGAAGMMVRPEGRSWALYLDA